MVVMANHRLRTTGDVGVFFIYDHDVLKREEDDMKDAILYFFPPYIPLDDQCSVCGQLMGVSEFLRSAVSRSAPSIFTLHQEKYCLKRVRNYTFALEGRPTDSNELLKRQLRHLYEGFVFVYGDIDNIRQQYNTHLGFLAEMKALWEMLFPSTSCLSVSHIERVFQVLPSVEVNSDLFLQASNILQSSQRRPGVTLGAILYKQRVLCTQMSPDLTRKLILIRPELPCAEMKTDFPLPAGVRLITIYVTDEEYSSIKPQHSQNSQGQYRHSDTSKFVWGKACPDYDRSKISESPRRFTKDESNIRRPSSRNDRNYSGRNSNMEIIPEIPSTLLSDITYVECEEKLKTTEKSNETKTSEVIKHTVKPESRTGLSSVKSELTGRKIVVTVSGEDSETISDLEDDDEETRPNVSPNKDKKFVKNIPETISADIIVHHCPDQSDGSTVENTSEKLPKIVTDHDGTSTVHGATETDSHSHSISNLSDQQREIRNDTEKDDTEVVIEQSGKSGSTVELSKGHNSPGVFRRQSPGFVSESEETGTESAYEVSGKSCDESVMSYLSSPENEENKETMVFRGSNYETAGDESSIDGGVTDQGNSADTPADVIVNTPDTSIETVQNSGSFESQTRSIDDGDGDSSQLWLPEKHGLHELTLYIQSHSEVCLVLLMEEESTVNENVLKALYKSSLTNMAELDYYVKEYIAQCPNDGFMDSYNFLRYDSFFQTVKGNALQPLTGEDEEFHRLAGQMHSDFEENPDMTNVIFRSHGGSCYGNKTINNETYFCMTNQADSRIESAPLSKDPVFSLDLLAREKLSKAHKITLL